MTAKKRNAFRNGTLAWFAVNRRDLPWRRTADPWHILVSEVMLQQTQVGRVIPKYEEFVRRWPTPAACAAASLGEVLAVWQGLGYNRRGRNLWLAAGECVARFGGQVPADIEALRTIKGIGEYTSAAVMAFAFNRDAIVCDTNIRRIAARYFFGGEFSDAPDEPDLQSVLAAVLPSGSAREWYSALMDFGAAACTSRAPACADCPLRRGCAAVKLMASAALPKRRLIRPQTAFQGSRRQRRGAVIRELARHGGPLTRRELAVALGVSDASSFISELVREGLVLIEGDAVALP